MERSSNQTATLVMFVCTYRIPNSTPKNRFAALCCCPNVLALLGLLSTFTYCSRDHAVAVVLAALSSHCTTISRHAQISSPLSPGPSKTDSTNQEKLAINRSANIQPNRSSNGSRLRTTMHHENTQHIKGC
eukprot:935903-Amphidinium_carterae.1